MIKIYCDQCSRELPPAAKQIEIPRIVSIEGDSVKQAGPLNFCDQSCTSIWLAKNINKPTIHTVK